VDGSYRRRWDSEDLKMGERTCLKSSRRANEFHEFRYSCGPNSKATLLVGYNETIDWVVGLMAIHLDDLRLGRHGKCLMDIQWAPD